MTTVVTSPSPPRFSIGSRGVKYITDVNRIPNIPDADRARLNEVAKRYVFRVNDYYLGLVDWDDPADPIKQLIIPRQEELNDWGDLDASNEASVTVARGAQHKYRDTAQWYGLVGIARLREPGSGLAEVREVCERPGPFSERACAALEQLIADR